MKTLREALENSGVDLTKASISVEIELAKQSSSFKVPFFNYLIKIQTTLILTVFRFAYY